VQEMQALLLIAGGRDEAAGGYRQSTGLLDSEGFIRNYWVIVKQVFTQLNQAVD